jgi:hypothetical protein
MSDVVLAARVLTSCADELNHVSLRLAETSNQLEPLEADLTEHVEDFIVGLWTAHVEMGEKHPPEETRKALAHRAFDREKYRQILALRAARTRAKGRLSDLKEIVAAQRSIVSAAKTELEATEGPQPQWSGSGEFPRG